MKKLIYILLIIAVFPLLSAQEDLDQSQDRALAVRAARLDALRQLGEAIKGVRISSSTTVSNFVTESDKIEASFQGFIKGAQQLGEPKYQPDGTCEITMGITLDQVIVGLQEVWAQNSPCKTVSSPEQFEQIRQYEQKKMFTATGSGAMKRAPVPAATENLWLRVSPQGKLMALRSARVDAYRNMAETIQGVKIDAETKVKDFVTESDTIRAAFDGFVRGVEFVGEPRYLPEGIVEVTAQVDLNKLISALSNISQQCYQGDKWPAEKFQGIQSYSAKIIKATGSGAIPKHMLRGVPYVTPNIPNVPTQPDKPVVVPPVVIPPVTPSEYIPEWANRTIKVTGMGARRADIENQDEARTLARRAAQVDGYRQLIEQVMGLELRSVTNVKDFVTQYDEINAKVYSHIRGAKVIEFRDLEDGTAEAVMELYLGDVWQLIVAQYHGKYGK